MTRPGPALAARAARGAGGLAVGLAVAMLLAGCSLGDGSERKAARQARNQATAAALQQRLAQLPGVVEVKVSYVDMFSDTGAARANLAVARGTDMESLADQVVGEVWRAPFEPLYTIRVGVQLADDRPVVARRFYTTPADEALLRSRYGPRPAPTR